MKSKKIDYFMMTSGNCYLEVPKEIHEDAEFSISVIGLLAWCLEIDILSLEEQIRKKYPSYERLALKDNLFDGFFKEESEVKEFLKDYNKQIKKRVLELI